MQENLGGGEKERKTSCNYVIISKIIKEELTLYVYLACRLRFMLVSE